MSYANLRNIYLRSLTEATDDEEKKRKEEEEKKKQEREKEQEEQKRQQEQKQETDDEQKGDDNNDSNDTTDPEPPDDGDEEEPAVQDDQQQEGEPEEDPDAEIDPDSVTDVDGSGSEDEFDMGGDPPGEGEGDEVPGDSSDGTGDSSDDNAETNLQVNILKLSKLDRALAKRNCFDYFSSLRSTIQTTLNLIEKNETVLDAEIRAKASDDLNDYLAKIQTYLQFKFPTVNYEEAMTAYYTFVQEINLIIDGLRREGITSNGRKKSEKDNNDNEKKKTKE